MTTQRQRSVTRHSIDSSANLRETGPKSESVLGSKEYAYVRGESVQRLLEEEWVIPSNVSKELGLIFDLLARDFIFSWYNDIQAYQETDHGLIGDIQALFVQACGIIFSPTSCAKFSHISPGENV